MEEHISSCNDCKAYLEYTVMLIDNTSLMAKNDRIPAEKKAALWNKIESKITPRVSKGDAHVYNMSGLEDEYIPGPAITPSTKEKGSLPHTPWSSFKYYVSGLAAVFALAFFIYMVSQFRQGSEINVISTNIVETSAKWKVSNLKGSPMIDNILMKNTDSIGIGQYLITDDTSRAELTVANLGTVTIEPNSKIRFVKSIDGENRIELVYGTIDANVLAKPRSFFVDAGKVTAVDLGCAYKISMDEKGDGLLYVKSGRVSLESAGGRESLVPEGKFCVLKKDFGPGTPFRGDTSPQLKKALMDFDFGECGSQCVNIILKNAKKTDAVTLLNIIPRVDDEYKTIVYNKVSNYCAPPKNLPKDSIPRCDKIEKLNEWVDKVMEEVHKNLEENMKVLEENMKNFDNEKWGKEWEKWGKEWGKDWSKNFKDNWNFNYAPMDTNVKYDFNFEVPSPEEMQELQQDLNDMQKDLKRDNEEFKKEMEQLKIELQHVGEDIKKESLERQKEAEERQKEAEERMKEMQERQKEREDMMKEKHEKMEKEHEKDKDNDDNDLDDK
jgi:hypothetical protein